MLGVFASGWSVLCSALQMDSCGLDGAVLLEVAV